MLAPLNEMVLIRPSDEPDITPGGIHLPQKAKKPSQYGEVVASGWEEVHKGDIVLYSQNNAAEVTDEGEKLLLVPKTNILAIKE